MNCKANYYQDGVVTLFLYNECDLKWLYKPLKEQILLDYMSFPNTKELHIHQITEEYYEETLRLVRIIKSLYKIPIFCYYDFDKIKHKELQFLCDGVFNLMEPEST